MIHGKFIVVEGGEGTGKSTFCQLLAENLNQNGTHSILTREPGGTPRAEKIREVFALGNEFDPPDPWTETFLICAARKDHLTHKVLPKLQAGTWVICDRFDISSRVYQGVLGNLQEDPRFETCLTTAQGDLKVDITFLLDCPTEIAMSRTSQRETKPDDISRYDKQKFEWFEKLRRAYQETTKQHSQNCHILDTSSSTPEQLVHQALQIISRYSHNS